MFKLTRYVLYDILRNKIVIAYTLFLLLVSFVFFQVEENSSKAVLNLLFIILFAIPLVSLIFSTIHFYNSYEFIELMLSQPLSRRKIFLNEYAGVAFSLAIAFLIGVGLPVLIYVPNALGVSLIFIGEMLTFIFTSLAFLAAVKSRDKARGIGSAILLWFYFALIYDGLLFVILYALSDYPLEKFTLVLAALNPIDLARIFILLKVDVSAMMGITSALFKDFFGSFTGLMFTSGIMLLWIVLPLWWALRVFRRKDI